MNDNVVIKKIDSTEIEISGELDSGAFEKYRPAAMRKLGENLELPGFRKGHVPPNILLEKLGPMKILEEMTELALRELYPKIIAENKIEAIDRPRITITKIADNNPLGFKITQTVLPEIKLPDYRKIAGEINKKLDAEEKPIEGTEEEVQEKKLRVKDKRRLAIVDAILDKTEIALPKVLVERQMDRFMSEMHENLTRMQVKLEDYLTHTKKTEAEVREASRPDAEKRVRTQLLLESISKTEKIEIPHSEIEQELKHILEHYKNSDEEVARDYVTNVIRNTKTFELLETLVS